MVYSLNLLTFYANVANSLTSNVLYSTVANVSDPNNNDSYPGLQLLCYRKVDEIAFSIADLIM